MTEKTPAKLPWALIAGAIVVLVGAKLGIDHWIGQNAAASSQADPAAHQAAMDVRLITAARNGDLPNARLALQQGASVNAFDRQGETALSTALKSGAWEIASLCLAQKFSPEVSYPGEDGKSGCIGDVALYWACRQGRVDAVRQLLDLGARPSGRQKGLPIFKGLNVFKNSPLSGAVAAGSPEIIELLVKKGAETNGLFDDGVPLLWLAVRARNLAVLQYILKEIPRYDVPVNGVSTADFAVSEGWTEGVAALLDARYLPTRGMSDNYFVGMKDAKMRAQIKQAAAPHFFLSAANSDILQRAGQIAADFYGGTTPWTAQRIKSLPPEYLQVADSRRWTLLSYAIDAGRLDIARLLVAAGAKVNFPVEDGGTPLALAVKTNNLPAVEFLVASGANLEACRMGGSTALEWAILTQNQPIFTWLLSHGARVEPPGGVLPKPRENMSLDLSQPPGPPLLTPLMVAASTGNEFMAKRLLEAKANPKQIDGDGRPVVLFALLGKHAEVVKLLTDRGVNLNAEIANAAPLLAAALSREDIPTAQALLDLGVPLKGEPAGAPPGKRDAAKLVADARAKALLAPEVQEAIFWSKLGQRSPEEVGAFIDKGGHANFPGPEMPLQKAVGYGRTDLAQALLEKGAEPNLHGGDNWTPIVIYAVQRARGEDQGCDMIRTLAKHGAEIDAPQPDSGLVEERYDGQTALMNSIFRGSSKMTRTLLDLGARASARDSKGRTVDWYWEHGVNSDDATRRLVRSWLDAALKAEAAEVPKKKAAF